ncbi:CopG family antitoxin [Candidatus Tisiphia endosymbiont of Nedyus quadrimaculatus]|uniref:CopG family antitoxin n=1 Tax=Candidatus Tisiphia endosymbiont of Nedyus quadrimaculatus TaxID=3139332 RepID=UPI00345E241A
MKKNDFSEILLDQEEELLSNSFDNEEWQTIKNIQQEKKRALEAANNYLQKDMRINIRISSSDLNRIKQKAAYEGLPYQTLIASILHKYSAGHL